MRQTISTDRAPAAIGSYSQAVTSTAGKTTFISGQIPLDPQTMVMISDDFGAQAHQVFRNLQAVAHASGASLDDSVKLTVYLVDLANFETLNQVMSEYLKAPFPARAAVQVAALPRGALIEIDAILMHE